MNKRSVLKSWVSTIAGAGLIDVGDSVLVSKERNLGPRGPRASRCRSSRRAMELACSTETGEQGDPPFF
jgi:hypothetical protein